MNNENVTNGNVTNGSTFRVLGVDPGSRKTGWGVVDICLRERRMTHVDNGVIILDVKADLSARLLELSRKLAAVIETYRPSASAVEDVFVSKGARSALTLGQARGAVVATLGLHGVSVTTIAAAQVKARVTGRGRASKTQVAEMVCVLLSLPELPFEDAADALAVALCHGLTSLGPLALRAPTTLPGYSSTVYSSTGSTSSLAAAQASAVRSGRRGRAGLADLARAQGKI